jgi:hydrogenase maturation protease
MTGRTLVAGVGNVFQRDDAFGVEVVRLLADRPRPDGVEIADFGIRGVHLVLELLNGCDLFVLIDAAQRGHEPGTVTVLEVKPGDAAASGATVIDAHGLAPDDIFLMLASMGGQLGRSLVVACEPADVSEGMGLSDQVRAALPHAVRAVEEILEEILEESSNEPSGKGTDDGVQADHGGSHSGGTGGGGEFAAGHQALHRAKADVTDVADAADVSGDVEGEVSRA